MARDRNLAGSDSVPMFMSFDKLPEVVAAMAMFGIFVLIPLAMLFLRHQRQMAELIHGKANIETLQRLENVERELRELKALRHEQVLREDDQQELTRRLT